MEYLFSESNANLENVFGLEIPGTMEVEDINLFGFQSQQFLEPSSPILQLDPKYVVVTSTYFEPREGPSLTPYNHIEELENEIPIHDAGPVSFTDLEFRQPLGSVLPQRQLETTQHQLVTALLKKRFLTLWHHDNHYWQYFLFENSTGTHCSHGLSEKNFTIYYVPTTLMPRLSCSGPFRYAAFAFASSSMTSDNSAQHTSLYLARCYKPCRAHFR